MLVRTTRAVAEGMFSFARTLFFGTLVGTLCIHDELKRQGIRKELLSELSPTQAFYLKQLGRFKHIPIARANYSNECLKLGINLGEIRRYIEPSAIEEFIKACKRAA